MTIQELAQEASEWFETATRDDDEGTRFVRVKAGAPEWVTDLAHEAHGDMLPDDWRYQKIADALEAIAGADDVDDARGDFADSAVDVYTSGRYSWLSSHLSRSGYVDEATDNFGPAESVDEAIGRGQYFEADEVYGFVVRFLEERELELEDDDEGEA